MRTGMQMPVQTAGQDVQQVSSAIEKVIEWVQAMQNIASMNSEMAQRIISRAFGEPPTLPPPQGKPAPVPNGVLANLDEKLCALRETIEHQTSLLNRIESIV